MRKLCEHKRYDLWCRSYSEFVSFRNAHSDLACNKILEAMQTNGPVWAAEFQAGTREHHVRSDANDLETFIRLHLHTE